MHPSRLSPASPYVTRTSPIRHGKRFGSLSVPEEHREAALKIGSDSIYLVWVTAWNIAYIVA